MSKEVAARQLYRRFRFSSETLFSHFKKALVHKSFYANDTEIGNSRYVFVGQFGFKGYVASLCFKLVAGNGTQLQHYLGNVFGIKQLEKIFDTLKLQQVISYSPTFEVHKHKHIFVFGLLGFLHEHGSEEQRYNLAYEFFLKDSAHLLPAANGTNLIRLLQFKAEQLCQSKVRFVLTQPEPDRYTTQVVLKQTQEVIAEHSSKSKVYAKAKAVKLALRYLNSLEEQLPSYQAAEAQRKARETAEMEAKKALKQAQHESRTQEKQVARKAVIEARKAAAFERDKKRIITKKNIKAKATEGLSKRELKKREEEALAKMSANKRRHLQDKAK